MMITVHVTGDKQWVRKTGRLSRDINTIAVKPALRDLRVAIDATLKQTFSSSTGGADRGVAYRHGYTGGYLRSIRTELKEDSLTYYEGNSDIGERLRQGTRPSKKGVIPGNVVEWAIGKLAVEKREAFAIAKSIAIRGIGWSGGQSPLPREHPVGKSYFRFPEWIVEIKNKKDIEKAAKKIGGLTVQYLEK